MSKDLLDFTEMLLVTTEYHRTVEIIARKYTKGTSISWEDAAQTAHEKVWQVTQAGKCSTEGVKEFYYWVAKVAKNAIIDLVRRETHQNCESLNQNIPGTDLLLQDTVPDKFDLQSAIEFKDLLVRTIEAINQLERCYPKLGYVQLWLGLVNGKTQSEIAIQLGVNQGTISKRLKDLRKHIAQMLGLLQAENIQRELQKTRQLHEGRKRFRHQW